jgi:hypothetical protein
VSGDAISGTPPNVPTRAEREALNHPASGDGANFGPDSPHSFEDETWFSWVQQTTSEREGCSLNEAAQYIVRNTGEESDLIARGEWSRVRDETIPLKRMDDSA